MKLRKWGIEFDFQPIVGMLHALLGVQLIGAAFFVDRLGWWNIPYVLVVIIYLSTADHVMGRIMKC